MKQEKENKRKRKIQWFREEDNEYIEVTRASEYCTLINALEKKQYDFKSPVKENIVSVTGEVIFKKGNRYDAADVWDVADWLVARVI